MSLFDKKKNKLDTLMETAHQKILDYNPITCRAKAILNEAADNITQSLEFELYGKTKGRPERHPSVLDDFDSVSAEWDRMIDCIIDRELGKYKLCPGCGEAVSSELEICPHCGASLPEETVASDFLMKP